MNIEFFGQNILVNYLIETEKNKRMGNSYIFTGPSNIGKLEIARYFSKYLQCKDKKNNEPCRKCSNCLKIQKGIFVDNLEITLDKNKTKIAIEQIKENVNEFAKFSPSDGFYKICIIHPAEKMSIEATNALLKILEEPPKDFLFILISSNHFMLLPTIRSRCQILKFRSLPVKQIETNILNYFNFDKIKVRIAAQLSQGCILKALEYVNTNIMDFRKIVITKFSSVMEMKRFFEFHNFINELIEIQRKFKVEINNDSIVSNYDYDLKLIILELILSYLRDLFFWKVLNIENKILNSDFIEQIKEISEKYNEIELKKFIDNLFCSFRLMNNNVRDFLLYENIFL